MPRIATGFGAGLARHGEVCGALSGAIMALGLKFGRERGDDNEAKAAIYAKVKQLMEAFEKHFGTISCRELTGCDLMSEEGFKRFASLDMHNQLCPQFVAFAVEEVLAIVG